MAPGGRQRAASGRRQRGPPAGRRPCRQCRQCPTDRRVRLACSGSRRRAGASGRGGGGRLPVAGGAGRRGGALIAMATGYFSLVLHAHLPFVRHPEDPTVMEERWLQEAIVGTYLPLLQIFEGLASDGIPFRCTVSLSAPLITMLTDDLLKLRFAEHLDSLIELGEKEIDRTKHEPHYQKLAIMYRDRFSSLRHTWR